MSVSRTKSAALVSSITRVVERTLAKKVCARLADCEQQRIVLKRGREKRFVESGTMTIAFLAEVIVPV
jgi:hypothetical protein